MVDNNTDKIISRVCGWVAMGAVAGVCLFVFLVAVGMAEYAGRGRVNSDAGRLFVGIVEAVRGGR